MPDNDRLQSILDRAGDVTIPPATYLIDTNSALRPRSNSRIFLAGVTLKAIPSTREKYDIILFQQVQNIQLHSGTLLGDRSTARPSGAADGGMGISIKNSSNITVSGSLCANMWGDGFYIYHANTSILDAVVAHNNRRQGLSIIAGSDLHIIGSDFSGTNGAKPGDGIDIEPDKGDVVDGVEIVGCKIFNNSGACIEIAPKRGSVKNVYIHSNILKGGVPIKGLPVTPWNKLKGMWGDYSGYPTEFKGSF